MKKEYIDPKIVVVELKSVAPVLLVGSPGSIPLPGGYVIDDSGDIH